MNSLIHFGPCSGRAQGIGNEQEDLLEEPGDL